MVNTMIIKSEPLKSPKIKPNPLLKLSDIFEAIPVDKIWFIITNKPIESNANDVKPIANVAVLLNSTNVAAKYFKKIG